MIFKKKKPDVSEEEKKRVLGDLYEEYKDKVDWGYYQFKKKLKEKDTK